MTDTTVWIDTDAALTAAHRWALLGDEARRRASEVELVARAAGSGTWQGAVRHLSAAATELWSASDRLRRAVDDSAGIDATCTLRSAGPNLSGTASSILGDLGGTGQIEQRSPFATWRASPIGRGRELVARALSDTADPNRIRPDEFLVVQITQDQWIVVLPGVVDLSEPDLGWNDLHRSVRDLDRAALGSSRSTAVDDNPYARMVRQVLVGAGVPTGSELLLVGHSFGADTALDLAADPGFNGASSFRVTHVVAAGYHSEPQLSEVPDRTDVLVLRNRFDVPVLVEQVGAAGATGAAAERVAAIRALRRLDLPDAIRHRMTAATHDVELVASAATRLATRWENAARLGIGVLTGGPANALAGAAGLVTPAPGVESVAPGQIISTFDGGWSGFGHHPSHYVDHVETVTDPAVTEFLTSLDQAGYTRSGTASAIDVSVP